MMTEIEKLTQETRNRLAAQMGISPEQLRARDSEWLEQIGNGVIVKVHCGRGRGKTKLTYHALGIEAPKGKERKQIDDLLQLGHMLLMPKAIAKKANSLESRARQCPRKHGSESPWGDYVTAEKFADCDKELNEIQTEYLNLFNDATTPEGWENWKLIVIDQLKAAARHAYKTKFKKENADGSTIDQAEEKFVNRYVSVLMRELPERETIRDSVYMHFDFSYAPLISELESERVKLEQVNSQRYQMDLQEEILKAERDRATAEARAEETAQLEMHRRIAENAAQRKNELIDSFLVGFARKLYAIFYEASDAILTTTRKNQKVHNRSITQLENLLDTARKLEKFGNEIPDIELMVENMRGILVDCRLGNANVSDIERTLESVAIVSRNGLLELGENPRSKRSESLPEVPTFNEVSNARRSLRGESSALEFAFPEMSGKRRSAAKVELEAV